MKMIRPHAAEIVSLGLLLAFSNAFAQGEIPGSEDTNTTATVADSAKGSVEESYSLRTQRRDRRVHIDPGSAHSGERLMFPTRRLSLLLVMVVFSSTALASAYEIDRPDSVVQPSAPYYPLLFSAFISNLAGHLGLGNDRMILRRLDLAFDLASLESPTGAFQTDTAVRLTGTGCRAPVTYDLWLSPASGDLLTAMRPQTALAVDEFYSPDDTIGGSRGGLLSIETGDSR